jgi:hypothetical protein
MILLNFQNMNLDFIKKGLPFITVSLLACNSETTNIISESPDVIKTIQTGTKNDNGFYDIPSPIQQAQLLEKTGTTYDNSILNPLENVSRYSIANSKALNLGVYAADLSYTAAFNKPKDVVLYLNASQKLAEELSIKGDFYTDIMKRMETNNGNQDSVLQIVSEVYSRSNESLKENDQSHISALVVAGSFIEGMYIATHATDDENAKEVIYKRIGEFKGALNNLVGLMTTVYDNDFSNVLADLKSIKAIYDETPESKLNEDQISKITKQIKAIRIRITNT